MALRFFSFRRRRVFLVLITLFLVYLIVLIYGSRSSQLKPIVCDYGPEVQDKLKDLLIRTKTCLDSLSLSHFLCYNSLWGALKMGSVLPWLDYLEVCILNEELSKLEEAFVIRIFKQEDLSMSYSMATGVYEITDSKEITPAIKIVIFEKDSVSEQYRRVGWRNRILPPSSCEVIHCFPPRLLDKPLPATKLLNIEMNVPHEEIELQKYLFPNSWWQDLEPAECRKPPKKSVNSNNFDKR